MIKIKNCNILPSELKLGVPIEMEHTRSKRVAERIAKQHLCEFKYYYSKGLLPMERRLLREIRTKKENPLYNFGDIK